MIYKIINGRKLIVADVSDTPDWNAGENEPGFIFNKPDLSYLDNFKQLDIDRLERITLPIVKSTNSATITAVLIPDLSYNCNLGSSSAGAGPYCQFNINDSIMFTIYRTTGGTDTNNIGYEFRVNRIGGSNCTCILKGRSTSGESGGQTTNTAKANFGNLTTALAANGVAPSSSNRNVYLDSNGFNQLNSDSASKGHELEFTILKDLTGVNAQGYIVRLYFHTDVRRFIFTVSRIF